GMPGLGSLGAVAAMVMDGRRKGSLIVHHSDLTRHGAGCSADGSRRCIHCSIVKPDWRGSRRTRKKKAREGRLGLFEAAAAAGKGGISRKGLVSGRAGMEGPFSSS